MAVGAAARAQERVPDVVEALADERHAEHDQHDREARERARPPDAGRGVGERLVEVVAPLGGGRRLDAEPEEPQARQGQDRLGRVEGRDDGERLRHVREHVTAQDPRGADADDPRGVDVGLGLHRQGRVAHDAEVLRHEHDRDRQGRGEDATEGAALPARQHDRDDDRQEQRGERVERVHHQHEDAIEPSAEVAGDESERYAHEARQHDGEDDDLHRGPCPEHDPGEDVLPAHRRAEPVRRGRPLLRAEPDAVGVAHGVEVVGGDPRCEQRDHDEQRHETEAEQQHEALQAVRLAHDGRDGESEAACHQNLTRGSTIATMTSMRKDVMPTISAIRVTMPWTARKSRAIRYSESS